MPPTRPSECPACGHEGIRRANPQPEGRSRREVRTEIWMCRLCGYVWTRPVPPIPPPLDEIDAAHP